MLKDSRRDTLAQKPCLACDYPCKVVMTRMSYQKDSHVSSHELMKKTQVPDTLRSDLLSVFSAGGNATASFMKALSRHDNPHVVLAC